MHPDDVPAGRRAERNSGSPGLLSVLPVPAGPRDPARVVEFDRVIDDLKRDARPCHDPVSVEGGHISRNLCSVEPGFARTWSGRGATSSPR